MLAVVARGLRDLKDQVVFVGGSVVDLYITRPGVAPLRATDDVDCVIAITSRVDYATLEEKLRALDFEHPIGEAGVPICRWRFQGIAVDVMPAEGNVLGFSNRWYPEGMSNAERVKLADGTEILVFSLPYFIASKLEAFLNRGKGDFYGSADIEDIMTVVDGADDFLEKMSNAPASAKSYLKGKFEELLRNELFVESIPGHLGPEAGIGRTEKALKALREITG